MPTLSGCFKNDDKRYYEERSSISDAKSVFDKTSNRLSHRITESKSDCDAILLSLGDFTPMWDESVCSVNAERGTTVFDVPIENNTISYRAVYGQDSLSDDVIVPMFHRLVVQHKSKQGYSDCSVVFYLPQISYMDQHGEQAFSGMVNNEKNRKYSGYLIVTSLDGIITRVEAYENGAVTDVVDLFHSTDRTEYGAALIEAFGLFDNVLIQRGYSKLTKKNQVCTYGDYIALGDGYYQASNGDIYYDSNGDGTPDSYVLTPSYCYGDLSGNDDFSGGYTGGGLGDGLGDLPPSNGGNNSDGGGGGGVSFPNKRSVNNPLLLDWIEEYECGDYVGLALNSVLYKGYEVSKNCFTLASDIARQLGASVNDSRGSDGYPETYFKEENGALVPTVTDPGTKVVDRLGKLLKDGFPVVVGVHYAFGRDYNDKTVDHWVVVYGFGFDDDGNIYFDYNETNRSSAHWDDTHGPNFRFYLDVENGWLKADHFANGKKTGKPYYLTVIRNMKKNK